MEPLTAVQVRRAMVNCSRGEASGLTLPRDFGTLDWSVLDFLGWRDPKAPLRGYLATRTRERLVGVALRAAESRMSARITALCMLCRTARAGGDVTLFTAARAGRAGRDGNTVGTYICADLRCSANIRGAATLPGQPDRMVPLADRAAGLHTRLAAFVAEVLG